VDGDRVIRVGWRRNQERNRAPAATQARAFFVPGTQSPPPHSRGGWDRTNGCRRSSEKSTRAARGPLAQGPCCRRWRAWGRKVRRAASTGVPRRGTEPGASIIDHGPASKCNAAVVEISAVQKDSSLPPGVHPPRHTNGRNRRGERTSPPVITATMHLERLPQRIRRPFVARMGPPAETQDISSCGSGRAMPRAGTPRRVRRAAGARAGYGCGMSGEGMCRRRKTPSGT